MNNQENIGKLILRLSIGVLLLMHGLFKLINGIDGVGRMVTNVGWPYFIAYGVLIGEVLAPALIILGVLTRLSAVVIAINMIIAIYLVHLNDIWTITKSGAWGLELQALFLFGAVAIAFLGAGNYSLGGSRGRFN